MVGKKEVIGRCFEMSPEESGHSSGGAFAIESRNLNTPHILLWWAPVALLRAIITESTFSVLTRSWKVAKESIGPQGCWRVHGHCPFVVKEELVEEGKQRKKSTVGYRSEKDHKQHSSDHCRSLNNKWNGETESCCFHFCSFFDLFWSFFIVVLECYRYYDRLTFCGTSDL